MRWDMYDRYGNQIYLTKERWQHALEKRPWLDISTVQLLPASPLTVTHLEPPPQALKTLVPMLA